MWRNTIFLVTGLIMEGYGSRSYITSMVRIMIISMLPTRQQGDLPCGADGSLIRRIGDKARLLNLWGLWFPAPYDVDITENGVLWASNREDTVWSVSMPMEPIVRRGQRFGKHRRLCGCATLPISLFVGRIFVTGEKHC